MKFIHTADWQIGMKAAHVGSAGERVRSERLHAASRVVNIAHSHNAEFILVAGDTFEDNGVDRVLVQRIADILGKFRGPVYLIPGNHDPLVPGSVWDHPAWKSHGNLTLCPRNEAMQIAGGWLFPCPLVEKHSPRDPTHWIDARERREICIGLAHGTVEGISQDTLDYPIPRDAAARSGLDYLGIGHWHSYGTIPGADGIARLAYSGTHETTKFGERDSGNVLLVEIDRRGEAPRFTPIRSGGLQWEVFAEELRDPGNAERVREKLAAISDPEHALVDLRLSGFIFPTDQPEIERIGELLKARFLYGRIDEALLPPPDDERWLEALPTGLVREVAAELRRLTQPAEPRGDFEYATPEVASQAILQLYKLVKGAAR